MKGLEVRFIWQISCSQITYADIAFVNNAEYLLAVNPTILDATPKLKALSERINAIPSIAKYIENRPKTEM